jgi:hypothetical protein
LAASSPERPQSALAEAARKKTCTDRIKLDASTLAKPENKRYVLFLAAFATPPSRAISERRFWESFLAAHAREYPHSLALIHIS